MKMLSPEETIQLARNHVLNVRWRVEHRAFTGFIPGLVGGCCHGDRSERVVTQFRDIAEVLVKKGEQVDSDDLLVRLAAS